jgi:hypothetical protein
VTERERVAEIAQRDLHPDALRAKPARVAHEAAHWRSGGREAGQQGHPHRPRRTCQEQHRGEATDEPGL